MDIGRSDIMALYPTKVLLDKNKKPFIPFVTAESIMFNNTDKSLADMLYNRYTKEEVDNIIKNLGTIQVLRGRVNTYEDLLAIENPQAGDVYIVGTSETDNAEYIYIGTTWEKLGPLVDLSTLVTLDELASRLGVYATIAYVDALIKSRPVVESETSAAMTGEELHLAILNKTLKDNVIVICTSDYLDYKTGHTYLISEAVSEGKPIVDQLKALGFTVNIASTLNSNNAKYYYIAEKADGDIYAAYSQVSLDTSSSKFPESGWKTFGVARRSSSDPKFLYNDGYDTNKILNYALTPSDSSSTSDYYVPNFSGALGATYSNDPTATAYTYYSNGEGDIILVATDITPVQEIDTSDFADATVTYNGLAARPTFEQTNNLIDSAINGTKDTRFLKYIGHYPDEDSLPFAGQESATLVQNNPYTYTNDLRNPNFNIDDIKAIVKEKYFIGTYVSPTEYSLIGFDDPTQLEELRLIPDVEDNSQSGKARVSAQVMICTKFGKGASNNPRFVLYSSRTSATSSRFTNSTKTHMCWYDIGSDSRMERDTPSYVYSPIRGFIQSAPNMCCNVTGRVFNYLNDDYGCLKVASYNYPLRWTSEYKTQMVLQFADNFTYDLNMALLKFDDNCQPVWFTAEGECTVNDIVSYGDQGDYRRFSGEAWVPMGIQSSDVFSYVDTALGTAEAAVDAIIDGGV